MDATHHALGFPFINFILLVGAIIGNGVLTWVGIRSLWEINRQGIERSAALLTEIQFLHARLDRLPRGTLVCQLAQEGPPP